MITHEQAKESLRVLYFHIFEVDSQEERMMYKMANLVFDYIEQQIELDVNKNKKHYDFEYSIISDFLKNGHHIRAFYDSIEPSYILYWKTMELCEITSKCFNQLIKNLEHRPSGRPCEECYVWKD